MVMSFRVVVRDSSKGPPDDRARFGADQRGRYTTLRGTTPQNEVAASSSAASTTVAVNAMTRGPSVLFGEAVERVLATDELSRVKFAA